MFGKNDSGSSGSMAVVVLIMKYSLGMFFFFLTLCEAAAKGRGGNHTQLKNYAGFGRRGGAFLSTTGSFTLSSGGGNQAGDRP